MTTRSEKPNTGSNIEYHCSVFYRFNKLAKQQEYCIRVETTKLFDTLNYKLNVSSQKKKQALDLNILGLLPDQTYLSEVKPAISDNFFTELYGDYIINVILKDGSINCARYNFNLFKKEITLTEEFLKPVKSMKQFCKFHTAADLNTFS